MLRVQNEMRRGDEERARTRKGIDKKMNKLIGKREQKTAVLERQREREMGGGLGEGREKQRREILPEEQDGGRWLSICDAHTCVCVSLLPSLLLLIYLCMCACMVECMCVKILL